MKKKIFTAILSATLAITLIGNSLVFAADIVNFSDGLSDEEEEVADFTSEEVIEFDSEEEVTSASRILEEDWNHLQLNKYYGFDTLKNTWGYLLKLNIPEDGRIRVRIEDCHTESIGDFLIPVYPNIHGYYNWYGWESREAETIDSGWITVKEGIYAPKFTASNVNKEAKLIVEYQKKGEFTGELEYNDKFDNATFMENNVMYEGNYSREGDVDFYKFTLDAPAKVEILVKAKNNESNSCILYEEDENFNVYEIKDNLSSRLRLGAGTYYVKVFPQYFDESHMYTICAKTEKESPEAFEQERNDISGFANEKQINTWYTGNLNTIDDRDYYKFKLDKPGKSKLEFKVPRQTSAGLVEATLFDKDLKEIVTIKNTENPYIASKEKELPKGEYYVRVKSNGYFKEDYSICLSKEKYKYVEKIIMPEGNWLYKGTEGYLIIQILPEDAADSTLEWSSSEPDVISIEKDGFFVAKNVGTAILTARACDGSGVMADKEIEVVPITDISEMTFSKVKNYTYTGKGIKPSLSIKYGGITLKKDRDYTLTYKNNKNVGTASIIVTGKGNYTGKKTINFTILPKTTSISSVTQAGNGKLKISWKKGTNITGYAIYRSTSKNGTYKKIKTITNASTTSYTNNKLLGSKTYYCIVSLIFSVSTTSVKK